MMKISGITVNELRRVLEVTQIIIKDESKGGGVTLSVIDGLRSWVMVDDYHQVMVVGEPDTFEGIFVVPLTIVKMAYCSHLNNESEIELQISDGVAKFIIGPSCAESPLLSQCDTFIDFDKKDASVAKLKNKELMHMIGCATDWPSGVAGGEIKKVPPIAHINFEPNEIEILTEFAEAKCQRVKISQVAETHGDAGQFAVNRDALRMVIEMFRGSYGDDLIETVAIYADINAGSRMLIEGSTWKLTLNRFWLGTAKYRKMLPEILEKNKVKYSVAKDNCIVAKIDSKTVKIDILDGDSPVARCVIEENIRVEENPEIMSEILKSNKSLERKSKFYIENKKLVSQLDFECENTSDIFSEISEFIAEVINFEPYVKILGSLSATYKKPKLAKSKGV